VLVDQVREQASISSATPLFPAPGYSTSGTEEPVDTSLTVRELWVEVVSAKSDAATLTSRVFRVQQNANHLAAECRSLFGGPAPKALHQMFRVQESRNI
jgi:hypothetical protein